VTILGEISGNTQRDERQYPKNKMKIFRDMNNNMRKIAKNLTT